METSETPSQPESTVAFASKLVLELQQAITQHEAGAMAGGVESVHDMRVGIRRLRVAMSNFAVCFRKKERRRWLNNLENLANALGGVRDLDVMISALKRRQAVMPGNAEGSPDEDQAAIAAFISRLQARRRRRLRQLGAYLRSQEYAAFKQEFSTDNPESFEESFMSS